MTQSLAQLKHKLQENGLISDGVPSESILDFQRGTHLKLPKDLSDYFRLINGMHEQYDDQLFRLYALKDFISTDKKFSNWNGSPNYQAVVGKFKHCFVFADYQFHLFSYAIQLHETDYPSNDIYVICGKDYKIICNSFSKFVQMYLEASAELHF